MAKQKHGQRNFQDNCPLRNQQNNKTFSCGSNSILKCDKKLRLVAKKNALGSCLLRFHVDMTGHVTKRALSRGRKEVTHHSGVSTPPQPLRSKSEVSPPENFKIFHGNITKSQAPNIGDWFRSYIMTLFQPQKLYRAKCEKLQINTKYPIGIFIILM